MDTLLLIRIVHTVVWAIFAGAIVAIPLFTWLGRHGVAWALIAFVMLEVLVLFANRMRCPLTDVAARYTDDRQDNFDIYLPRWLARYNKHVFGTLYVAGIGFTLWAGGLPRLGG
ncbi:MAG: hypothetical protein SF172_05350 [Burkholderiales bacterium]|nr:hypothetical protein [Burkholderiales bacterium]